MTISMNVVNEVIELLGPAPHSFNYHNGTDRFERLRDHNSTNVLLQPPAGAPLGTVGLEACEILAGPGYGSYGMENTLDSLATWVVPLLILVVNLNYAAFERHKYYNQVTIALHLFGNPIHAIWALLTKLDVKRRIELRCRDHFKRNGLPQDDIWIYSTILYVLDDFNYSRQFENHFQQLMMIANSEYNKAGDRRFFIACSK